MSGKLVLVTGVTGFVAGHITHQLLEKGYRVRGSTREAKINTLREAVKLPGLEFTTIDDVAKSDVTEALKGVDIVMHVASPLPGHQGVDETISTAVEGTLNILRQAEKAGIEKVIVTSSFGALLDPSLKASFTGENLTDSDWAKVTIEEVREKASDPFYVYFASKYLAERAAWDFAKDHPKLDLATILPGYIYGPFSDHFPYPSKSNLGTAGFPYRLTKGIMPPLWPPWFVDVRDVAKAHILTLDLPRLPLEQKRFLINAGNYSWKEAVVHLKISRPQVTPPPLESFPTPPGPATTLDTTRAKEVLKMEYISPAKTMEDLVDNMEIIEKTWA